MIECPFIGTCMRMQENRGKRCQENLPKMQAAAKTYVAACMGQYDH